MTKSFRILQCSSGYSVHPDINPYRVFPCHAFTTLEEALAFLREEMEPDKVDLTLREIDERFCQMQNVIETVELIDSIDPVAVDFVAGNA